uniref:Capsid protein n=1 Tax=unidentified TaxID=32644 RepID=A0A6G9W2D9_9ZZZZ|nr:hypothetical protein [unidentified]
MPRTSTSTRRTYGPRKKYSLARTAVTATVTAAAATAAGGLGDQVAVPIVASSAAQGKRKCKNFDINLGAFTGQIGDPMIYYALVYVPAGTTPSQLSITASTEYYTPAANVLAAGVYDTDQGTGFRVRTRLARNLNAGDEIRLLLRASCNANPGDIGLRGIVTYVVAYN